MRETQWAPEQVDGCPEVGYSGRALLCWLIPRVLVAKFLFRAMDDDRLPVLAPVLASDSSDGIQGAFS